MKTIRKDLVYSVEYIKYTFCEISERSESFVTGYLDNGEMVRIDTSLDSIEFEVIDNKIHIAPKIILNDGEYKFIYSNDQQALIDYTRATEQLNNPNLNYINF